MDAEMMIVSSIEKYVVDAYFGNDYFRKPASDDISELKNAVLDIDDMLAQGQ